MNKRLKRHFPEIFIILALIIITALPRLVYLKHLPAGLHGDEAWTGLDSREIATTGYIGPYTDHALGQPTGPLYWTALMFSLFGESIFVLRTSMAFFGIITIPLFYILARLFFNRFASTLASIAFSLSLFHIHFSHIAFMLIATPVFQIVALIFLFISISKKIYVIW